jgi:hypothetical protein
MNEENGIRQKYFNLDIKNLLKEEFYFSVKMFFAPVTAILNELKSDLKRVDADVDKVCPPNRLAVD